LFIDLFVAAILRPAAGAPLRIREFVLRDEENLENQVNNLDLLGGGAYRYSTIFFPLQPRGQ